MLGDPAAAEDAFQATFLVLFRRAGSIRVEESLAPWLMHVARLAALKARQGETRRRTREALPRPQRPYPPRQSRPTSTSLLCRGHRLPAKYRDLVRLCDFEGQTHDDAAAALGWPVGTVRGRWSRRGHVRKRFMRRASALAQRADHDGGLRTRCSG